MSNSSHGSRDIRSGQNDLSRHSKISIAVPGIIGYSYLSKYQNVLYGIQNATRWFLEIKKQSILVTAILSVIAAGTGVAIVTVNNNAGINGLLLSIPLIIFSMAVGIALGLRRQKKLFESYRLTVTEETIKREQFNTPVISIPFNEISKITKTAKGGFIIHGKSSTELIIIPFFIEEQEKIEELLSPVKSFSAINKGWSQTFAFLLPSTAIASMAMVFLSHNKIVVGISGVVFLTLTGYSIWMIVNSKNIDKKTKRLTWLILFVICSVIVNMYHKLLGLYN